MLVLPSPPQKSLTFPPFPNTRKLQQSSDYFHSNKPPSLMGQTRSRTLSIAPSLRDCMRQSSHICTSQRKTPSGPTTLEQSPWVSAASATAQHNPGEGCKVPLQPRDASYNSPNYFSHFAHLKACCFLLPKQCICKKCNNVTEPCIWGVASEQNQNKHKIKAGQLCSLTSSASIAECKVPITDVSGRSLSDTPYSQWRHRGSLLKWSD